MAEEHSGIGLADIIVCNSSRGDPKGRGIVGEKKEVSTGRLVHYILAGLMHWLQSRCTHLRDRLPQALTHPVASHTCDIPTQGYTGSEKVYRYTRRAEQGSTEISLADRR